MHGFPRLQALIRGPTSPDVPEQGLPPAPGRTQARPGSRVPAWIAFLLGSLAMSAAALLVRQPEAHAVLNGLAGVGAGVAIAAGTRYNRPRPMWPWLFFAAGILCYGFGDLCYSLLQLTGEIPQLSAGDVFYLAAAALLVVALAGFASRRHGSARAARMLYVDSAAIFVGAFALLWFFAIDPLFDRSQQSAVTQTLSVTFPTLDVLLLALAARLALTPAIKLRSYRLLTAGIALGFMGDILWRCFPEAAGGRWISASYYLSYALVGAAALHPGMRDLTLLIASPDSGVTVRRLVLLSAASLAVPLMFFAEAPSSWDSFDIAIFVFAAVAIPALIIYRFVDLVGYSRALAESATRTSARIAAVLDATPLPVRVLDPGGDVLLMNKAGERWNERGLFGTAERELADGDPFVRDLRRRAVAGETFEGIEMCLRTTGGEARQVQVWTAPIRTHEKLDAVVSVFADVTEQRQREERARFLADHDSLTGLLNRRGFQSSLEYAVQRAHDGAHAFLAVLDVDNFNLVNDSAGHPVGDQVLVGLAQALAGVLHADDVLARLSGDEFAVIFNRPATEQARRVFDRLLAASCDYRLVETATSISVTISIGVCALTPGTTPKDALTRADVALHEAKEQGRNRIVIWSGADGQSSASAATLDWSTRIKDALDEDRFLVYLQPIVELATGEVVQYEALARLLERGGSIAPPGAFIPPAGRLGLMPALDRAILGKVVALLERDRSLRISVNLDPASFADDVLLDRLEQILAGTPHLAGRLGIEITESTSLRDTDLTHRRLTRLKELNCTVAIDDFGTGFASFARLRELPADVVKISHSFVAHVDVDAGAAALVQAIVTVSRALGKQVIAEGVETAEVAAALRAFDIRYAQGYLFGRPAPAESVLAGSTRAGEEPAALAPPRQRVVVRAA